MITTRSIPSAMSRITPNECQQQALKEMHHWYTMEDKRNRPYYTLSGAAGTGKTTLIRYFLEQEGMSLNDIICCAYVGKAVTVLAANGLPAQTIHSLIYYRSITYEKDEDGMIKLNNQGMPITKMVFALKEKLDHPYKLIVCDEASMVDERLEADLLSFGVPIIFMGDHNQLPPIFGVSRVMLHPDSVLTQIMRQEKDNPIIYLSQLAIHGIPFKVGNYGDSKVSTSVSAGTNLLTEYDNIIVGTNKTRKYFIDHIRHNVLRLESKLPYEGEKLICRQNNWNQPLGDGFYLTNGTIGTVTSIEYSRMKKGKVPITFVPEVTGKAVEEIMLDTEYIKLSPEEQKDYGLSPSNKFEYGYAITAHLSQGSQCPRVLFIDGRFHDEETTRKLRYTAITRAQKTVHIVVRGPRY